MPQYDYDLFTIGAGSGGVRASRFAANLGARVGVAEERYLGGTCVNVGCIPKKLLILVKHLFFAATTGDEFEAINGRIAGSHMTPGRVRGERETQMKSTNSTARASTAGKWRKRSRTIALLCAAAYAAGAQADAGSQDSWPQVWLNPGIYSQHFDSSKGLRNNNIGVGAEVMLAGDHVLMAGSFINSNRVRTRFAGYEWRPLHWKLSGVDLGAGIVVGAFDGYPNYRDGAWFVAPLPMLSIEGKTLGANISLIPTVANRFDGALAVQIKLRVW